MYGVISVLQEEGKWREVAHLLYLPTQKFAPLLIQTTAKRRGQYGKYTPEQKAMIGKRAAEHGVVANLCIPDHFTLVVTSYHSFHFETARGVV